MNRFFRTVYSATLVYLCLALFGVLITGIRMPFPAFSCLYFGLLLFLLPGISQRLIGKERLCHVIGAVTAVLGFLPIAFLHCPMIHWLIHLLGIAAAGVFLSSLRHATTHSFFMANFRFSVASLLILIGFVCLVMLTDIRQDGRAPVRSEAVNLAVSSVVPWAIVLLASGVLLLRGLRAQPGSADEQAFNRRQLRDTLIFAILVTLVFAADPFVWLEKALFFLFSEVLRPSARFLAGYLYSFLRLISFWKEPAEDPLTTEETVEQRPVPTAEPAEVETEHYLVEGNDLSLTLAYIFTAAAVLILLYILALQILKLVRNLRERSRSRGSGYPSETRETLPAKEEKGR